MPHNDTVSDSEFAALAPAGVSTHVMRVRYLGVVGSGATMTRARAFADPPHIDDGAELLSEIRPDAIAYCFTSSSYILGPDGDAALKARLETRTKGVPVTITCLAAVSALRALSVRRVALIHPPWFAEEVDLRGKDYFQAHGFEVVYHGRAALRDTGLNIHAGPLYEWAQANVPREAEAVFLGGNGMRAIGVIQALEEALGKPVLTSNQVTFWHALHLSNKTTRVDGYGQLFNKGMARG